MCAWRNNEARSADSAACAAERRALRLVRYINTAAEALTCWPSREMLGMQIEKGMPILRAVSKSQKPLSFRMTLHEPWNGDVEALPKSRPNRPPAHNRRGHRYRGFALGSRVCKSCSNSSLNSRTSLKSR